MRQLVEQLTPFATFYLRKLQKHLAILVIPVWTLYSWLLGQLSVTASSVITVLSNGSLGDSSNVSSLMFAISSLGISSSSSISLPAVSTTSFRNVIGDTPFFSRSPIFCFYYPFKIFLPLIGILTCIIFGKFINDDWTLTSLADRFTVCFFIFVLLTFNIFVHLDLSSMHFTFRYFLIFINSLSD